MQNIFLKDKREEPTLRVRVVHVITDLSIGGAEMMLYKLVSNLDRERFDSHIILLLEGGALSTKVEELGIPVTNLGMKRRRLNIIPFFRLVRILNCIEPDIIQGWMYISNVFSSLACTFLRHKPRVIWNIRHSINRLDAEKRLTKVLIRIGVRISHKVQFLIYNSNVSAEQHHKLGYDNKRATVIPNGFDINKFVPSKISRDSIRDELGLPPSSLVIGMVARYHPIKGHDVFLEAAYSLVYNSKFSNVRFVLVGRGLTTSNELLVNEIRKKNLEDRFHLLGERTDLEKVTNVFDVATSSSYSEGFSNTIGEAMACGIPCVVTDVGDSAWIVGDTGVVVNPGNVESLMLGWEALLKLARNERETLGEKARCRIVEMFSVDDIASQYALLYENAKDERKRRQHN